MVDNIEELEDSLDSIDIGIEVNLEDITLPYNECKHLGGLIWGLIDLYKSRALLKYLLNADVEGFFEDLNREALTYFTLLKSYHNGFDVDKSRINGSYFLPLSCSLAAKNFSLARDIDSLLPKKASVYDSEELFAYTNVLRSLINEKSDDIEYSFPIFKDKCSGFLRYDHKIRILEGIVKKDTDSFNIGLKSYINSFENISAGEAEEMDPGDEYIDLESLAYIQLAKRNDIPILFKHSMIPEELQVPKLILPDSGYPKWIE